jgi:hypothetical protein
VSVDAEVRFCNLSGGHEFLGSKASIFVPAAYIAKWQNGREQIDEIL